HSFVQLLSDNTLRIISENRAWAGPVVLGLAFAESMAVLSVAVPFTAMILGIGALLCAPGTVLDPWWLLAWGIAGASAGDAVSYWIGRYFKDRVPRMWPFRKNREPLERGYRFFARWGVLSVFVGRFLGPLRAVVPLIAGMMRMPQLQFQVSNVVSAIVWLPMLVFTGCAIGKIVGYALADVGKVGEQVFGYVFLFFLAVSLIGALAAWIHSRIRAARVARQSRPDG
ncbi:MAG: DedA family protein, partial [Alphaproteobacteria bacterium]